MLDTALCPHRHRALHAAVLTVDMFTPVELNDQEAARLPTLLALMPGSGSLAQAVDLGMWLLP